jgi:phage-related protein
MKTVIDHRDDPLVKGPCAAIAYARQTNGKRPAFDYIETLEKEDWAKLAKSFTKMAQVGKIWDTERFRKLCGKIWEFKIHPKVRVLCFQSGKTWFLTHGFDKETGNTPRKEIERAEWIMREHIAQSET